MTQIIEMVDRVIKDGAELATQRAVNLVDALIAETSQDAYQGRKYKYGSRILYRGYAEIPCIATVTNCESAFLDPEWDSWDGVDQQGKAVWGYDSQIMEVLAK